MGILNHLFNLIIFLLSIVQVRYLNKDPLNLFQLCKPNLVLQSLNKFILGNSVLSSRSLLNEDEIFLGKENPVVYKRFYEMVINCEMELQQYPFDNQTCSIGVNFPKLFAQPGLYGAFWPLTSSKLVQYVKLKDFG